MEVAGNSTSDVRSAWCIRPTELLSSGVPTAATSHVTAWHRGHAPNVYGNQAEGTAIADVLDLWQKDGDPGLWKMIISPEFGERVDLNRLTDKLMGRMEKDLGTHLDWMAVPHFNTEHPHVHAAVRGIRADGSALGLKPEYIRNGIRSIAEDLCTRQIGHRNQADAIAAERREVQECR